jgi:hypothetical protein
VRAQAGREGQGRHDAMTEAEFLRLLSNLSKSIEVLNRKSDAMNSPIERFQMTLRDLNPGS